MMREQLLKIIENLKNTYTNITIICEAIYCVVNSATKILLCKYFNNIVL